MNELERDFLVASTAEAERVARRQRVKTGGCAEWRSSPPCSHAWRWAR